MSLDILFVTADKSPSPNRIHEDMSSQEYPFQWSLSRTSFDRRHEVNARSKSVAVDL